MLKTRYDFYVMYEHDEYFMQDILYPGLKAIREMDGYKNQYVLELRRNAGNCIYCEYKEIQGL